VKDPARDKPLNSGWKGGRFWVVDGVIGLDLRDSPLVCRSMISTSSKPDTRTSAFSRSQPMMYLHLCCEGWQRFGPFQWLSLQDREGVIVDEKGVVIAKREEGGWLAIDPRFEGATWENPTITIGPEHPHPNGGGHPRFSRS
jgi:hypothetical protein